MKNKVVKVILSLFLLAAVAMPIVGMHHASNNSNSLIKTNIIWPDPIE